LPSVTQDPHIRNSEIGEFGNSGEIGAKLETESQFPSESESKFDNTLNSVIKSFIPLFEKMLNKNQLQFMVLV